MEPDDQTALQSLLVYYKYDIINYLTAIFSEYIEYKASNAVLGISSFFI